MALCHPCMAGQPFAPQQSASQEAVPDVRFLPVALYARRIGQEDADVVEHGGFVEEGFVGVKFGMSPRHIHGHHRHTAAMLEKDVAKRRIVRIILVYQSLYIHHTRLYINIQRIRFAG